MEEEKEITHIEKKPEIDKEILFSQLNDRIIELSSKDEEAKRILDSLLTTIRSDNTNTIIDVVRILDFLETLETSNRGSNLVSFLYQVLDINKTIESFEITKHFDKLNQYTKSLFLYEAIQHTVSSLLSPEEIIRRNEISFMFSPSILDEALSNKTQHRLIISAASRVWYNVQFNTSLLHHYSRSHMHALSIISTLYLLKSNSFNKVFEPFQNQLLYLIQKNKQEEEEIELLTHKTKLDDDDDDFHKKNTTTNNNRSDHNLTNNQILFSIFFLSPSDSVSLLRDIGIISDKFESK